MNNQPLRSPARPTVQRTGLMSSNQSNATTSTAAPQRLLMKRYLYLALALSLASCATATTEATIDQRLDEKPRIYPRAASLRISPLQSQVPQRSKPWSPGNKRRK